MDNEPPIEAVPYSREAEEFTLSGCFLDGTDALNLCIQAGVTPITFHQPAHQLIFEVMLDLHAAQKPIDLGTISEELRIIRKLEQIGGYAFLTEISRKIPTTAQLQYHVERVRDCHKLRELIMRSRRLIEACSDFKGSWSDEILPLIERVGGAVEGQTAARTWRQAVAEGLDTTKERMKAPEDRKLKQSELSWGIRDFDRFFQPVETGELVVIGGYTSSGKSSLLRQVAWAMAQQSHPTLMETLEMKDHDEAVNLAGLISGVPPRGRLHQMDERDKKALLAAFDKLLVDNFSVCHLDHNLNGILARARTFKRKSGLRVLAIDYLQLLEDVVTARDMSGRALAIGRVTGMLKQFAMRENLAVILLSGFNREAVRENKTPRLVSLEGSSAIEKDADRVLLIHTPTDYIIEGMKASQSLTADAGEQPRFFVQVIQAKGRSQGTSQVDMFFERATKTFKQISR